MATRRRTVGIGIAAGAAFALTALVLLWGIRPAEGGERPEAELGLLERVKRLEDDVKFLRRASPPVGSVAAFAGQWPPRGANGEKLAEADIGWLLCDGRAIEGDAYKPLREALGTNVLPDYRGYFLRGHDGGTSRDPNRALGSPQDWATALPTAPKRTPITMNQAGEHTHQLSVRQNGGDNDKHGAEVTTHDKYWNETGRAGEGKGMKPAGGHAHTLAGGDTETRPMNVSVNWAIRYR